MIYVIGGSMNGRVVDWTLPTIDLPIRPKITPLNYFKPQSELVPIEIETYRLRTFTVPRTPKSSPRQVFVYVLAGFEPENLLDILLQLSSGDP